MAILKDVLQQAGEVSRIIVGDNIEFINKAGSEGLTAKLDKNGLFKFERSVEESSVLTDSSSSSIAITTTESVIAAVALTEDILASAGSFAFSGILNNTGSANETVTFNINRNGVTGKSYTIAVDIGSTSQAISLSDMLWADSVITDVISVTAVGANSNVVIDGSIQPMLFEVKKSTSLEESLKENQYQTKTNDLTNDPTGIASWKDSVITGDASTRTFTITPVGSEYIMFSAGKLITKTSPESIIFPDTEGLHIIYFDTDGVLKDTDTFDALKFLVGADILVTMFYWDADAKEFLLHSLLNERHGLMNGQTHARLHYSDGMLITNGMALLDFDLSEDGSSLACLQYGVEEGWLADEDIMPFVNAKTKDLERPIIYISGSTPNWRNASNTTGTNVLNTGSGRLAYNQNSAGSWLLSEVPNNYYVNYHVFAATADEDGKEIFTIPGQAVYESKSDAIVNQVAEILSLTTSGLNLPEFHAVGSILYRTSDAYTNVAKAVVVPIGGGLAYRDLIKSTYGSGTVSVEDLIIPVNLIRDTKIDTIMSESDMEVHGDTTNNNITVTMPTISTLGRTDRVWTIRKISQDNNTLYAKLNSPTDSQFGESVHAFKLSKMGDAVRIGITDNKKYYAEYMHFPVENIANPVVSTLSPSLVSTTLTMNGDLADIAAEDSVIAYFRYSVEGSGSWTDSTTVTLNSAQSYSIDATIITGVEYEVQAMCEDSIGTKFYGDVKVTTSNYYSNIASAQSDQLLRYWDMQELTGVDSIEKLGSGEDMYGFNTPTISSDIINGNTIYKKDFTNQAYLESAFKPNWTWTGSSITMLIQADIRTVSGDRTLFSVGRNILSAAADMDTVQVNTNNFIQAWATATPTGMVNMFFVVDTQDWYVRLYTVTPSSVIQRTNVWDNPDNISEYLRIGRGTNGDGNHQDNEYLSDGSVRSIAVWGRTLSNNEMMDIANTLDTKGMLLV